MIRPFLIKTSYAIGAPPLVESHYRCLLSQIVARWSETCGEIGVSAARAGYAAERYTEDSLMRILVIAAALLGALCLGAASPQAAEETTLRFMPQADLRSLDPV